ncbi:MAG TPA: RICIN domain-containing protein [Polyangiaceae bacterium]|nr:RICIN domain-containing protein [Polyangiaceae bacterium]
MKKSIVTSVLALSAASLFAGCSAEYEPYEPEAGEEFGTTESAVSSCVGDDLQYDFNGFAASLAVAIGKELGRWDVTSDFVVSNGRLALSPTGTTLCGTGCGNVKAILSLQEDSTSVVPNHSPSMFRTKLTGWYATQQQKLIEMATANLLAAGTYRFISRGNNTRVAVGATTSGSAVGTYTSAPSAGADEWRAEINGDRHKFVNVKSGLCMDLASDSNADNVVLQQKTCSASSTTQRFQIEVVDSGFAGIKTKYGKAVTIKGYTSTQATPSVQLAWNQYHNFHHWTIQSVSGGSGITDLVANGMYTIRANHNGTTQKPIAVENGATTDGALVKQYTYSDQDKFHWYVSKVGSQYQLINRRSGKCLALLTDNSTSTAMGQKTCADVSSQKFTFAKAGVTGERSFTIKGPYNKWLTIRNYETADGTPLYLASTSVPGSPNGMFTLAPIRAGEPHRLNYSHETPDAPCGVYKWYTITQPNGLPLTSPANAFVQLIFAGGKTSLNGADENPFIAQQTTGTLIAVDPSGYLNGGSSAASGSCLASDILYETTGASLGLCCIRYNGVAGVFKKSAWSSATLLCQ